MTEHQVSDHVAEKIREARKQRGWSTADLAQRCGLSRAIIENIEGGRRDADGHRRRDVTVDELFAISEALNIGPLILLPARKIDSVDRERVMQAVGRDLAKDRERLANLAGEIARFEEERRATEDRLEKNSWLLEQLRQDNQSLMITVTRLPRED
jgi:transcriptional regulator with XRE-family HTH domain